MAEITYQMVLSTLQTAGLLVGISYYILSLRNQNRARQVQTFLSIYSRISTPENVELLSELQDMEWDDYHDFEMKYGSDVNPENRNKRYAYWYLLDGIGFILKKGWVDRDVMFAILNASSFHWLWEKHGPIIKEIRKRYNLPNLAINFEYLVKENKKMMLERGQSPELPEELGKYIPDKQQ
jgi:hypothetical protein